MRPARLLVAAVVLTALTTFRAPAEATAAPPTLAHLFPAGGQRGCKISVTCTGNFSWPVMAWAPGIEVVVGEESGKLEVSIPEHLATDRVWIRLYNAEGISQAVPFLIGSLQEVVEREPNNALDDAQPLEVSRATVNGVLGESGDVDGFVVSLTAWQTLVASVAAHDHLGSPMDAILQVASTDGTVLAENHDDIGLDPRLAFTAPDTARYIVRLFAFPATPDTTIAFRGAADYIYRLTLTTGPFLTQAVPASVPESEPGTVQVHGWNIPPNTKLPVVPLGGTRLADHQEFEMRGDLRNPPAARLGFAFAPEFAGGERIRLVAHEVLPGIVPSDGDAVTLAPSVTVTGRLKARRQTDEYRLLLVQGQHVVIAVESRGLNLPLHSVVNLFDPAGGVVASIEPPEPQDIVITHAAAQEGVYRLTVGDRYRRGGDRCFYRLTVRLEQPDFELTAGADAIVVTADQPAEFPVTVQRRATPDGSIGAITIEAVGLPAGVTAAPVVSEPDGPTAAKVSLVFSTTGEAFSGPIRIVGTAVAPNQIKRFARAPARFGVGLETIWLTAVAKP